MGLIQLVTEHRRIMFDTAPLIYLIEEHPSFGDIVDEILRLIGEGCDHKAFSSVITLTEVLTHPMRESRPDLVEKYRSFLLHSSNFALYGVDHVVAEKAAVLRAHYGLRTPDALQVAVGVENGATLFVSNDRSLKKLKEIEVMILADWL
jgi:predicted nucleic acid-binding protein